jgi:RNA polymerase sigma-70 factor (ECF subfamily)
MWLYRKHNYSSDEELALAYFRTGNREYVGELFEKHVKTVYGVCLFYLKDKDAAKDTVMQIFEKLLTELRKSEVKSFKAWLSFVVRNFCISEIRKNKSKHFVSESYLDFELKEARLEEEEAIESVSEEAMLTYLQDSLHLLKPKQKVCVEMFYLKGMSYQDISKECGFSLNEVKSLIQNGKRNLKMMIEKKINTKNNAA